MRPRTLGVVGTFVWDRFEGPRETEGPWEAWGGIAYTLAALAVALPDPEWTIRPLAKVGADLAEEARAFTRGLGRVDDAALTVVPEPNNRVTLSYRSDASRVERLRGGVPPWRCRELAPLVDGCDALVVNFISGYELALDDTRALRAAFDGPIYADLHSLFLGRDDSGVRVPAPLARADAWLRCFDAVQLNEAELDLLAGGVAGGPERWVGAPGPSVVAVTLGERGARCAVSRAAAAVGSWGGVRPPTAADGAVRSCVAAGRPERGDPTGCGDVWGGAMAARLLAGDDVGDAMAFANRLAAINVTHRGAGTLAGALVSALRPEPTRGEAR